MTLFQMFCVTLHIPIHLKSSLIRVGKDFEGSKASITFGRDVSGLERRFKEGATKRYTYLSGSKLFFSIYELQNATDLAFVVPIRNQV